ncbi:hypothetical protein MTO96_011969 [Rhipicephalus appendiculatus]
MRSNEVQDETKAVGRAVATQQRLMGPGSDDGQGSPRRITDARPRDRATPAAVTNRAATAVRTPTLLDRRRDERSGPEDTLKGARHYRARQFPKAPVDAAPVGGLAAPEIENATAVHSGARCSETAPVSAAQAPSGTSHRRPLLSRCGNHQ